eukprot:g18607.t1
MDELAMETKRTALLDRLEGQLKAQNFTSRLLFSFNCTDDRKVQRAIDQEFSEWRKSRFEALNGILLYTQSVALHLLEGPTELIFKALELFHSLSAEMRKVPEVQEVAGPRQLLQGLLWAALAAFIVYLLCTWQALGAEGSWQDGYLAIAYRRFWQPLGIWVCISAALANTLLYTSELAVVARFLQSLGPKGLTDWLTDWFEGRPGRVLVLGGWSPGPLDVLRARMERVDFQEVNIPMPPSGCRWCLNPFCPLLLLVVFWLLPLALTSDELVNQVDGSISWLVRLVAVLAIPVLLRYLVAGLVWFSIKDARPVQAGRALRDFEPDVVLAFSWGGGLALWLLAERRWTGPTLLLAPTVNAMACVSCRSSPRFPAPRSSAPVHVFHAEQEHGQLLSDGFCPASQVAALRGAGCELHLCDDNHVLLRRQTVEEIHSCLKQLLSLSSSSDAWQNLSWEMAGCSAAWLDWHFFSAQRLSTLLHVVVYWWQLAAFLQLKLRHPELVRLYAVPGGRWGAALLCGLKAPVLVALVITGCQDWSMVLGALLVNVLFYFVVQCVK